MIGVFVCQLKACVNVVQRAEQVLIDTLGQCVELLTHRR